MTVTVSVPPNTQALLDLPVSEPYKIEESGNSLDRAAGIELLSSTQANCTFSLQSGSYQFYFRIDH
jgi:hypothetical protein